MKYFPFTIFCVLCLACSSKKVSKDYQSETLEIKKISDHVYRHVSFLTTNDFGKVACNGMIVVQDGEAIVFDAPTTDEGSIELVEWIHKNLKAKITAVIGTHFHDDCLGGLAAFHSEGIPSYAHQKTIELAKENEYVIPQNAFETRLELDLAGRQVFAEYFGEGHTVDNIVGYFPDAKALFGGCMLKSLGASKGYLGDANVSEWPLTVAAVKSKYPNIKLVIPGHGKPGGPELLDYTIELFSSTDK